jgi:Transcriptional regulator
MNVSLAPNGPPLDLVLVRTFIEIVDSGSFAAAADQLALTPSAISGHIRRLEQATGTALLARTTRRVALTQAGETLYAYGRHLIDLEREARAKLRGLSLRGRLRIGASEDFASAWLPQILQRFRQWHPGTRLEVKVAITGELLHLQEAGRLDIVFGKQCERVQGAGTLLWEEPIRWVIGAEHRLPADSPIPLALFPEPCVYRETALTALRTTDRAWQIVFESSSMAACLSAARAGFAATVIADSQRTNDLRVLGRGDGLPDLPKARFYAFALADSPASNALVDAARELAGIRLARRAFG